MNRLLLVFSIVWTFFSSTAIGAESTEDRSCNLQGREIALRISEEVNTTLSAAERKQIAEIAEQVCSDYAGQSNSYTVIERPVMSAQSELSVNEEVDESVSAESAETGLLGDIKIIDSEDRVRRPGLKRR